MVIRDRFLWLVVASVGISIAKVKKGPFVKCLTLFIAGTVVISTLHVALGWIYLFVRTRSMNDFWNFSIRSTSCAIGCLFLFHRKAISCNVLRLNRFLNRYGSWQRNDHSVKFTTVAIISVQLVNSSLQWNDDDVEFLSEIMTFGHDVKDSNLRNLLAAYALFAISLCYCVAFVLTFSATVLWYRWSEVLRAYEDHLRDVLRGKECNGSVKLCDLFEIIVLLDKFNRDFKSISFAIMVFIMDNLFMSVYEVLQMWKSPNVDYLYGTSTVLFLMSAVFLLGSYVACCSKVPETLECIQKSARQVTRRSWDGTFVSSRELFFCREVEKEQVLRVSACGMFYISKGIILSAFGAAFTYGLLLTDFLHAVDGTDDCKCTPGNS